MAVDQRSFGERVSDANSQLPPNPVGTPVPVVYADENDPIGARPVSV